MTLANLRQQNDTVHEMARVLCRLASTIKRGLSCNGAEVGLCGNAAKMPAQSHAVALGASTANRLSDMICKAVLRACALLDATSISQEKP